MGLRDAILDAVSSAVTSVGDIAEDLTYVTKTNAKYDIYSGKKEATETSYSLKAIVSIVGEKVNQGEITSGNTGGLSLVFASKGLEFTPKTNDIIIRNSERYAINKIDTDPANASYTLEIRRAG
jgi:hypothetical protein